MPVTDKLCKVGIKYYQYKFFMILNYYTFSIKRLLNDDFDMDNKGTLRYLGAG